MPSPEAEKKRYLLHKNDATDSGYSAWLEQFITEAVAPFVKPGSSILDFGSGPMPSLGEKLRTLGYRVSLYDPFFAPSPEWETQKFDAILLHEVFEHLLYPGLTLERLLSGIKPGGYLCIRSGFHADSTDSFDCWWYRSDVTHIGFMGRQTPGFLEEYYRIKLEYMNGTDIAVFRNLLAEAADGA